MPITISDTTPRVVTVVGGTPQTAFTVSFEWFADADLKVYKDGVLQTLTTHYTASGAGVSGGGTVTFGSAVSNATVTIIRDMAIARTANFPVSGSFDIGALNDDLAKITLMMLQMERDQQTLMFKADPFDTVNDLTIPIKATRASKVFAFDSSGDPETTLSSTNLTTLGAITSDITTVAGISANVTTVAGIAANVTAVAGDATDIGAVAAKATEIGRLGTSDAVTDMNTLGTADIVTDMNLLATSGNVTAMGLLGTSANVTAMGLLGVSGVITDMGILGTADVVNDMNILGTADVVTDMNVLATSDVVADMNTLATSAIVTDMDLLATSANVTAMGLLGVSDVITDMGILGTADVVTDMNVLGTADVVSDMNTLGTSGNVTNMNTLAGISSDITSVAADATDIGAVAGKATEIGRLGTVAAVADLAILGTADVVTDMSVLATADVVTDMNVLATADIVTDMNTLGTGANVTAMATVATNIAGVNSFAERYRVASSDPTGSLDEGDLYYNTTSNKLRFYNGSSWADSVATAQVTSVAVTGADGVSILSGSPITTSGTIALSGTGLTPRTGATGSANIPSGTTGQRDGSPAAGMFRYNSTTNEFEGYAGSSPSWGSIGGGAGYFLGNTAATGDTTSGLEDIFRVNSATCDNSCEIASGTNASATGPLTVSSGVTVTVSGVLAVI